MGWLLLTFSALACTLGGVVYNVRKLQAAEDEQEHLRLSVRFWKTLAGMGLIVPVMLVVPMVGWGVLKSIAAQTAAALAMLPPMALVGISTYTSAPAQPDARTLAIAGAGVARGVVVARHRRSMSADLIEVVIEVDLPAQVDLVQSAYRPHDLDRVDRHRFTEIFPSDQWLRFEPGVEVELRFDEDDLSSYAITRVFSSSRKITDGGQGAPKALPEATGASGHETQETGAGAHEGTSLEGTSLEGTSLDPA